MADAGLNKLSDHISTLNTSTTVAQSITNVVIGSTDLNGVDFGVNFDVIVNTNDSGQGSFRQFIINSNELANTNLDQEDNPLGGVTFEKPLGWETSIFMMPTAGLHSIVNTTVYPNITDDFTHISGYTQAGSSQGDIASRIINIGISSPSNLIDALIIDADNTTISGLCLLYTSPSPRDQRGSRMPSSA